MAATQRQLGDLISIGPAMLRDFEILGIRSVGQLAKQDPDRMYSKLERLTGQRQDPCVLDAFHAAVAQARNPRLPAEQCQWWYWSRVRKAQKKTAKPIKLVERPASVDTTHDAVAGVLRETADGRNRQPGCGSCQASP